MVILFITSWLTGCSDPDAEKRGDYIIKSSRLMLTSDAFLEELDIKRAAYPYTLRENPTEYNEMVIHLVHVLSEELVLLSAADQKGVTVTDQEIQLAEDEFLKDFPDDSFDQILLENAIPYLVWKKQFKKNLIMEKFIDQELKKKIEITTEEMVEFYNQNLVMSKNKADPDASVFTKIENEKELVSRLRFQKTQNRYDAWIQQLKTEYPVEINKDKLKTFLIEIENSEGSKYEKEN